MGSERIPSGLAPVSPILPVPAIFRNRDFVIVLEKKVGGKQIKGSVDVTPVSYTRV